MSTKKVSRGRHFRAYTKVRTSKGIVWTGPTISTTSHTRLNHDEIPGTVTIASGKYRVGASVDISFDEQLETKA